MVCLLLLVSDKKFKACSSKSFIYFCFLRISHNHKYPDTGGWAKYNAQFKREKRSISETSRETNLLHTLVTMVRVAELMNSKLEDLNEFTIFAPNLASFDNISRKEFLEILTDKDSLNSIIFKHIVPSKIKYEELENGSLNELKTIDGETVTIQKNKNNALISSKFGNATVVYTF